MSIKIRSKRVLIPTIATAAVLAAGAGVAWAVLDEDESLSSSQRDRAEKAALAEVGGGEVREVEADEEGGQRQYELEVVDLAGVEWDVVLDEKYDVVLAQQDDRDEDDGDDRGDRDEDDRDDADDTPVSPADRERVGAAAAAVVPGGEVVDVDRGEGAGVAWEVEVVDEQGQDWDVTLDDELTVLDTVRD